MTTSFAERRADTGKRKPVIKPSLAETFGRLDYSMRRYFVDDFYWRYVSALPAGSRVLDLGGNKTRKRGEFNIDDYGFEVTYVNISPEKNPDIVADAAHLPFEDNSWDAIICSELLEHVADPLQVLKEAVRVLKPGGRLLMCTPFLYRVHADPHDFGRYTDYYWRKQYEAVGLDIVMLERQGLFFSVLVDMVRGWAYELAKQGQPKRAWLRRRVVRWVAWGKRKALEWDAAAKPADYIASYTTGYGVVAIKADLPA